MQVMENLNSEPFKNQKKRDIKNISYTRITMESEKVPKYYSNVDKSKAI
jgi:hypothetical protein